MFWDIEEVSRIIRSNLKLSSNILALNKIFQLESCHLVTFRNIFMIIKWNILITYEIFWVPILWKLLIFDLIFIYRGYWLSSTVLIRKINYFPWKHKFYSKIDWTRNKIKYLLVRGSVLVQPTCFNVLKLHFIWIQMSNLQVG